MKQIKEFLTLRELSSKKLLKLETDANIKNRIASHLKRINLDVFFFLWTASIKTHEIVARNDHVWQTFSRIISAQSFGAVEYTGCISAEGKDPHPKQVSCGPVW